MSEGEYSGHGGVSRRDFIKVTTGIVGGIIGAAIGLPAIALHPGPGVPSRRQGRLDRGG